MKPKPKPVTIQGLAEAVLGALGMVAVLGVVMLGMGLCRIAQRLDQRLDIDDWSLITALGLSFCWVGERTHMRLFHDPVFGTFAQLVRFGVMLAGVFTVLMWIQDGRHAFVAPSHAYKIGLIATAVSVAAFDYWTKRKRQGQAGIGGAENPRRIRHNRVANIVLIVVGLALIALYFASGGHKGQPRGGPTAPDLAQKAAPRR